MKVLTASRGAGSSECRASVYQDERFRFSRRACELFFPEVRSPDGPPVHLQAWVDEDRERLYLRRAERGVGASLSRSPRDGSATLSCKAGVSWLRSRGDQRRSLPVHWDGEEQAVYLEPIPEGENR